MTLPAALPGDRQVGQVGHTQDHNLIEALLNALRTVTGPTVDDYLLGQSYNDLESKLTAVDGTLSTVESEIAALDTRLDAVEGVITATTAAVTYYVNFVTGNDTNDGLTTGTAFKTIEHALGEIPPIIKHNVDIRVVGNYTAAVTYNGTHLIGTAGGLVIQGNTSTRANQTVSNNWFFSGFSGERIVIQHFKFSGFTVDLTNARANVTFCDFDNAKIYFDDCVGSLTGCAFSNLAAEFTAVTADRGSQLLLDGNTYTSVTKGLLAKLGSFVARGASNGLGTEVTNPTVTAESGSLITRSAGQVMA